MAEVLYPGQHKGRVIVRESGIRRPLDPRFDLSVHLPSGFGRGQKTMARRSFRSRCSPMLLATTRVLFGSTTLSIAALSRFFLIVGRSGGAVYSLTST